MKTYRFLFFFILHTHAFAQDPIAFRTQIPGVSVATGNTTITINIPSEIALFIEKIHRFTSSPLQIGFVIGATTFATASFWKSYRVIDNFAHNETVEAKNNSKALLTYLALCSICVAGCKYS